MTRPLVSIIVPAYNHQIYIVQALRSVVEQDYRPIEIIVIDDGSKDETASVARDYLQSHMPSSIVVQRPNLGAANTINQAISISRGDFINVLNSDDFFTRERISACVDLALRRRSHFIFTGVRYIGDNGQSAEEDDYVKALRNVEYGAASLPTLGFALMKNQLAISTGNFFFSRQLFDKVGEFRNYRYVHDWDFILRCLFFVEPIKIEARCYNYRLHPNNSFKSLIDIASYETTEVMRNFLWSMTSRPPLNYRAPSPFYWPGLFEDYMRRWDYHVYMPPRHQLPFKKNEFIK